jgi:uncharacterized protein YpbB
MQGNKPEELLGKMVADRLEVAKEMREIAPEKKEPKKKAPKGESMRISLKMYREGMSIEKIAKERALAPGTIESHLCSFIPTGEIAVEELVSAEKMTAIQAVLDKAQEEMKSTEIRQILGEDFSFGEIRAVLSKRAMAGE